MILFKKKKHFEIAKKLRDHGMSTKKKYYHEEIGFNYRMSNIQAALGLAQIEQLEQIINEKRKIYNNYYATSTSFHP